MVHSTGHTFPSRPQKHCMVLTAAPSLSLPQLRAGEHVRTQCPRLAGKLELCPTLNISISINVLKEIHERSLPSKVNREQRQGLCEPTQTGTNTAKRAFIETLS